MARGKTLPFQTGRQGLERGIDVLNLGPTVEGHDVHQVDGPIVDASARGAGSLGNTFHFFEILRRHPAKEQGIGERARAFPGFGRCPRPLDGGETTQDRRDFVAQQSAMLVAALIGFAFDVQNDPARLGIAISRSIALHRRGIGAIIFDGPRVRARGARPG